MKVQINTPVVLQAMRAALPTREARQRFLEGLTAAAEAYWKKLALDELRSTSRDYVAGVVRMPSTKPGTEVLVLEGMLPNMVENGWPGGDMRAWMLRSPKAKTAKDGSRYLIVPFRHGTPDTGGRNVGRAMPQSIYDVAKKLKGTKTDATGKRSWGGRLHLGLRMSDEARKILGEKEKPWHTTSIYTGMVRNHKTYERASQSTYGTFRVISSKSRDPRSWIHPGLVPKHFAERVQARIATLANELMGGG